MANLLSEISEDFLIRVMAFEKALQERTTDYSYQIYMDEYEDGEMFYVGQFSTTRTGVRTCVRITEFDTHMLAEGIDNEWILNLNQPQKLVEVIDGLSEFKYAGIKMAKEDCWDEDEAAVNLEYHLPVVDEYCCDAEGYAQMVMEAFTLFRAEAFMFDQKFKSIE